MSTVVRSGQSNAVGCEELGLMGTIDTSKCCGRCHSADREILGGSLGPCQVSFPDGREFLVCCAAKKQLLGEVVS
ncbi:MAG: hypothetical protein H0V53_00950 [Rubrobacter sp.]|nr:hypothetical protein [Rubrobacter sp.]